jgi:MoxR-like ATPase
VLLIDEIDKSDEAFEAFLLEVPVGLPGVDPRDRHHQGQDPADGVPHLQQCARPGRRAEAPLPAPAHPAARRAAGGADRRHPRARRRSAAAGELVAFVQSLRTLDLRKVPSISETVDWARALVLLHAEALSTDLVRETLNVLLKFEQDIVAVEPKLAELLGRASEVSGAK